MEWPEFLKLYGPMGIGWILFIYLGNWVLKRIDKMMELATAVNGLTQIIKDKFK